MAAKVSSLILGLFVLADLTVEQHGQDAPIPASMTKRVGVALRLEREKGVARCDQGPGQYMLRTLSVD